MEKVYPLVNIYVDQLNKFVPMSESDTNPGQFVCDINIPENETIDDKTFTFTPYENGNVSEFNKTITLEGKS